MNLGRMVQLDGATGAVEDHDPMTAHVQAQVWDDTFVGLDTAVGNYSGILSAITDRVDPATILPESVPGIYVPYPDWTDPIIDHHD